MRASLAAALIVGCLGCLGCSGGGKQADPAPVFTFSGTLTVNGQARTGTSCAVLGTEDKDEALQLVLDDGSAIAFSTGDSKIFLSKEGKDRGREIGCSSSMGSIERIGHYMKAEFERSCTSEDGVRVKSDVTIECEKK